MIEKPIPPPIRIVKDDGGSHLPVAVGLFVFSVGMAAGAFFGYALATLMR